MRTILVLLALLAVSPALAGPPPVPAPATAPAATRPTGPCSRGASRIRMSGIDIDVMRCELAIANQTFAETTSVLIQHMANERLLQDDLRSADDSVAKLQSNVSALAKDIKKLDLEQDEDQDESPTD